MQEVVEVEVDTPGTQQVAGGTGGSGGGGNGSANVNCCTGTVNTGGGGGGAEELGQHLVFLLQGGSGGSGIVIVRAPSRILLFQHHQELNTVTTLPAPAGGCTVATFTVSGDLLIYIFPKS
jgi:hypothetical protein